VPCLPVPRQGSDHGAGLAAALPEDVHLLPVLGTHLPQIAVRKAYLVLNGVTGTGVRAGDAFSAPLVELALRIIAELGSRIAFPLIVFFCQICKHRLD